MLHCYRSYKSVTRPAATAHWQLFLQAVALDLMQVDDPRLYEMITTKEAIFAWEIKSGPTWLGVFYLGVFRLS